MAAVPVLQSPREVWRLPGPPKLRYALAVLAEQQGDSGVPAVLGLRLSLVDRHASPHAPPGRLRPLGRRPAAGQRGIPISLRPTAIRHSDLLRADTGEKGGSRLTFSPWGRCRPGCR